MAAPRLNYSQFTNIHNSHACACIIHVKNRLTEKKNMFKNHSENPTGQPQDNSLVTKKFFLQTYSLACMQYVICIYIHVHVHVSWAKGDSCFGICLCFMIGLNALRLNSIQTTCGALHMVGVRVRIRIRIRFEFLC